MTIAQPSTALHRAVDRAAGELERWQVPGIELAVVRSGDCLYSGGVGVRAVDDTTPIGGGTLFHHGSCGKAYTGLLAAVLASDATVDLDAPVRRLVPELRLPDPVVAERVTLRDLLSHRAGLGRHDMSWILSPSMGEDELLRRLAHLPLAGDLRAQWLYSNFGYALAGLALGRAAGTGWSDALRVHVLDRLDLCRTFASVDAVDADAAQPHLLRDGQVVLTEPRTLAAVAPAGEVVSCADDSVRWLLAHLGAAGLPAATVDLTHQPHMLVPPGISPFPELSFVGYGLGWLAGTFRGRPLVWHNGGVDGFSTQTLLLPADGIGIVASANLHATNLPLAAVLDLADALLGTVEDPSWYDRLRAADPDDAAVPDQPTAADRMGPTHALSDYAGRYDGPGYGEVVVTVSPEGLGVRVGECDLTTRHRHFDTWDLHYAALDHDVTVTFGTDANGAVAEAALPLDPAFPPVRFTRVRETGAA